MTHDRDGRFKESTEAPFLPWRSGASSLWLYQPSSSQPPADGSYPEGALLHSRQRAAGCGFEPQKGQTVLSDHASCSICLMIPRLNWARTRTWWWIKIGGLKEM